MLQLGRDRLVGAGIPDLCRCALLAEQDTVTLTVSDNSGNAGTVSHQTSVQAPPTASFTVTPSTPQPTGTSLQFDGGGSTDPNGSPIARYDWAWGDGTESENSTDCAPYEAGKSEIKRRFTVEHTYRRAGNYRISFRMKRHEKIVGAATTNVQIRPGLRDIGQ